MYTKNVQAWIWPHQLLAAILQSMCHVKSKQKLLYSHKFRVPSQKKKYCSFDSGFFEKKKSADVNYLFTKSQLLISPPLYYTTLDILFSSNHNIHKSSYVLLFLGFRSFSWWILLKSFNKRVPSPKTKAIKSSMNVVIWRKKYI